MSRILGACFVASLLAAAGAARADDFDRLKLRLNGHVSLVGAYIDQTNMAGLDHGALALDTGLFGTAVLPLDGGGEIGGRIAVDLDYATNFDSFLNDAGASDVVEELWLYWEGRLGRVQLGLMDGAADILGFGVPQVSRSVRADNAEVFLLGYPCAALCSSEPQLPGSLFSPNGMQLRSDIHGSDDYLKIMYSTPVFHGFRFAVSFAPDGTRDPGELFDDGVPDDNEQANIWDIAANYQRTLGDVDLGLSAGYVTGENVNNSSVLFGDVEEWGAAVKLAYREWTAGVAYRETNVSGGGPIVQGLFTSNVYENERTDIWSFGLTYECGPWMFGATYITAEEELLASTDIQDGSGLQFAAGYTFNENVRITGGYQHFEFQGPANSCVTDEGGLGFPPCDTLDGDVGYVETTFSF